MAPPTDLPADDLAALPRWALVLGAVLALLGLLALAAPWAASWTWRGFWLRRSLG